MYRRWMADRAPPGCWWGPSPTWARRFSPILMQPVAMSQATLLEWTVVTRGPEGAAAYGDGIRLEEKASVVRAADSTGAGDVFAAGLVHALAAGRDMRSALGTAVAWGSASVRYEGTVPPEDFLTLVGTGDP